MTTITTTPDRNQRPVRIVLPRTTRTVREVVREVVQFPVPVAVPNDLDTDGDPVPTNGAHTFTYDASGNLKTDVVSTAAGTWVRTYTYDEGNQTGDSGWVKA